MDQPLIVQAEYSFKGGNNDELCFNKGDLITVTQREEGGWWEGTLNDKTGWFPSNYVNEYNAPLPTAEIIRPPEEVQEYRSVVLKDLLDSERAHVAEIQGLLENFLEPLQHANILNTDEYGQLMCNFVEVVRSHDELLTQMEECNDRVGKLFLTKAPHIKQIHQAYCAAHPKAIVILDKYKDELEKYMERQGAATPGLLVLTTGLSKPFRRLDKYSAMLQELERHMESSHPDRGDTQRSVAVYKDIAATCSATRRQKELELQVLTGPVRGWQGTELSSLGDIIHMGSVAVGADHRDRYFVLFPQTLVILSVSQRMSAFIYEGKLPLAGIVVNRLEDSDAFKNAFEISGPHNERLIAICQGPNEANRWVELLTTSHPSMPINIKRQLSNLSNSSVNAGNAPQPPPHMSPPANLNMLGQRSSAAPSAMGGTIAGATTTITSSTTPTTAAQHAAAAAAAAMSQHKRSLSFNHHLSYNQYNQHHAPHVPHHQQHPPAPHQQHHLALQQHQSLPNHQTAALSRKSNLAPTSNSISKNPTTIGNMQAPAPPISARNVNTRANWSITNLRPAPPLRPSLHASSVGNGGSSGAGNNLGGSGGAQSTLSNYSSGCKWHPTFEEDALVLRVFEAYCAAYQSNPRNTIHSALQPWTPCLPIRGGKLKTSKPFSTSNPQLPFICNAAGAQYPGSNNKHNHQQQQQQQQQNSTNSLNSSFIWREASPNNFNMYSTSVSSLNASGYRSSQGTPALDYRAMSEERATRKSLNRLKSGFGSGYDNIFMTPLLTRKNKPSPKVVRHVSNASNYQSTSSRSPPPRRNLSAEEQPLVEKTEQKIIAPAPGLYDRRLNRSFDAPSARYAGYGGGYMMGCGGLKTNVLRRSTPHLAGEELENDDENTTTCHGNHKGNCGGAFLGNGSNNTTAGTELNDAQRQSGTWCCGLENEDMTPTLRQLWTAIRQMQQDMTQIKLQINEERALRVSLQHLLTQHLETGSTSSSGNTPKC